MASKQAVERAVRKAQAVVAAWRTRYGATSTPSKDTVLRVLWVAEHETRCGDAWPGEHNWGAIQRRSMTAAEKSDVLAGRKPAPRDAFERLHGDSSPINGRYQCWFWAFPSDVEGAAKLLEVLLDKRPSIKARVETLTPALLAELMYRSRYYEGVHDPRPKPGTEPHPSGLTEGQRANIADYAGALGRHAVALGAALARWTPAGGLEPTEPAEPPPWPPTPESLDEPAQLQAALAACGHDPGQLDGVPGPRTKAAIRAYQKAAGLKVDGVAGPKTKTALAASCADKPRPEGV